MRMALGTLGLVGAALAAVGCARIGLNPMPGKAERGGMQHGLDPFPAAKHPEGTPDVGLDPFPAAMNPEGENDFGLNPFPREVDGRGEGGKVGLNPFPAPMHRGGSNATGLNPFPRKAKTGAKAARAAVSTASTRTVATDTPVSDEYPDQPPVILPATPDRSEDPVQLRKKKRPAWKDD